MFRNKERYVRGSAMTLLVGASALAAQSSKAGETARVQDVPSVRAAEHHLHIRTAAAAELMERMQEELGDVGTVAAFEPVTAEDVLAALDAANVERGLVLSVAYQFGAPDLDVADEYAKVRAENDYVASQVSLAPDRLVGACSVNPLAWYAGVEIRRCAELLHLPALKLHLANSDVDLRSEDHVERLASLFRTLDRLGMPAVVHLRTRNPDYGAEDARIFVDEVLSQAPRLPVQIAHMAGWGGYDDATDAALGVFAEALADGRLDPLVITFDLAAVVFQPAAAGADTALARFVRESNLTLAARISQIGPERVVFATDWPSWPPTRDLRRKIDQNARLIAAELPIPEGDLVTIFGNANAIVRRPR